MESETDRLVLESLGPLLERECSLSRVRSIERGESALSLWERVEELGFPDLLVAEQAGGAGLCLEDFGELVFHFGRHLVPMPLADTIVARSLLAEAGYEAPAGPVALASGAGSDSTICTRRQRDHLAVMNEATISIVVSHSNRNERVSLIVRSCTELAMRNLNVRPVHNNQTIDSIVVRQIEQEIVQQNIVLADINCVTE